MDNIILMIFTTFVITIIFAIITFIVTRKKTNKRYRKKANSLDIEKNQLLNVKILSEISKVRELVKTDNLKNKLEGWDNSFNYIKEDRLPKITDDISQVDMNMRMLLER